MNIEPLVWVLAALTVNVALTGWIITNAIDRLTTAVSDVPRDTMHTHPQVDPDS